MKLEAILESLFMVDEHNPRMKAQMPSGLLLATKWTPDSTVELAIGRRDGTYPSRQEVQNVKKLVILNHKKKGISGTMKQSVVREDKTDKHTYKWLTVAVKFANQTQIVM